MVRGIEVRNEDIGHPSFFRQAGQQFLECLQPAGRSPDSDDGKGIGLRRLGPRIRQRTFLVGLGYFLDSARCTFHGDSPHGKSWRLEKPIPAMPVGRTIRKPWTRRPTRFMTRIVLQLY